MVRVGHAAEVAGFDDPPASRALHQLLRVGAQGKVGSVPLTAQDLESRRLLAALWTLDDQHLVELAAGLAHAPNGSDEDDSRHGAHVLGILGSCFDQPSLHTRNAIPGP